MVGVEDICENDKRFIEALEKKLHFLEEHTMRSNMRGYPYPVKMDAYTEKAMAEIQAKRMLNIIERTDVLLFPINTNMGFSVEFRVVETRSTYPGMLDEVDHLLTFQEKQLPAGYDFQRLSEQFMQPRNLQLAERMGKNIVNSRDHYDY